MVMSGRVHGFSAEQTFSTAVADHIAMRAGEMDGSYIRLNGR